MRREGACGVFGREGAELRAKGGAVTSKDEKPTTTSPGELLHLWMGEPLSEPAPPRARGPLPFVGAAAVVLLAIALAKWAADVLLLIVALVAIGLLLHVVGTWLTESDLLSPGWFLALVLAAALGFWAFFYPTDGLEGLGRYVPKPVAQFFAWSESRGWAQRVLLRIGGHGAPVVGGTSSEGSAANADVAEDLTVTASRATARVGEPVGLTARFKSASAPPASIRFYDGLRLLGSAPVASDGRAWVASLTVTDLEPGNREITAVAGGLSRVGTTTATVRVSVLPAR